MTGQDSTKPRAATHGGNGVAPQKAGNHHMTETTHGAAIGAAVLELIAGTLAYDVEWDRRRLASIAALRAEGYRIITHENLEGEAWQIIDADTREVLATGVGHDAMDNAGPDELWYHEDNTFGSDEWPDWPASTLPAGLQTGIAEWVSGNSDEARRFLEDDSQ